MLTFKNAFFTPWYATKVLGIPRTTFVFSMLPGVLAMLMTAGASGLIAHNLHISGLFSLVICGIALTAIYLLVLWSFALKQLERQTLEYFIPFKVSNLLHFGSNHPRLNSK
jgi:membrane protein EpsK